MFKLIILNKYSCFLIIQKLDIREKLSGHGEIIMILSPVSIKLKVMLMEP